MAANEMGGRMGMTSQQAMEGIAQDPPEVDAALARLSAPAPRPTVIEQAIGALRVWAGDNAQRRKYLSGRIASILEADLTSSAREELKKLEAELDK
jgi:hypothetical protein